MQNYMTASVIPFPGTSVTLAERHIAPALPAPVISTAIHSAESFAVRLAKAVTASESSCTVNELAKLLKQNGINIGQNRLYDRLRNDGYLCRRTNIRNLPTQSAMNKGLFEIKETPFVTWNSACKLNRTILVTNKGLAHFINKYGREII